MITFLIIDFLQINKHPCSEEQLGWCLSYSFWVFIWNKKAIQSGVLTKSSRDEIVGAIASRMIQVTRTPTPSEYQGIRKKLVLEYPTLQDPFGNGCVSISVTRMLSLCVSSVSLCLYAISIWFSNYTSISL